MGMGGSIYSVIGSIPIVPVYAIMLLLVSDMSPLEDEVQVYVCTLYMYSILYCAYVTTGACTCKGL